VNQATSNSCDHATMPKYEISAMRNQLSQCHNSVRQQLQHLKDLRDGTWPSYCSWSVFCC